LESSESDDDIAGSSSDDDSSSSSSDESKKSLVIEETKDSYLPEITLYKQRTDREILRNIMLNVLYYYNCREKVDASMTKIEAPDKKDKNTKNHDDEDSIGSTDTKAEQLARAKTLQALDDCCFSIHFVL
jgi:hypothetical protein